MIRVDLGRSDAQRAKGKLGKFFSRKKKKGGRKSSRDPFKGLGKNAKTIIVIGLATALAYLPYLFVEQYKNYIREQHRLKVEEKNEKIALLKNEISKMSRLRKELESYEQQKKLVKDKIDVVRGLLARRGTPVSVLDALSQGLPKEVWLDNISLSLKGEESLELKGKALRNEDVSDYVENLKESVFIESAELRTMNESKEGDIDIRSFVISAKPKVEKLKSLSPERETADSAKTKTGSNNRRRRR